MIWQQGVNKQTEHLNIELVNGDIRLDLKSNPHIQILASHPPCYVDIQQNTVGQLYGEYTANLLYHFLQMPDLPSMLLPEFEKLTHQYSDVKNLPQPESIQHIDVLEG
ncbi:heavy metal resistance protein CzcA, partial [Acinetobacter sp. ACNIH3]